MSEDNNVNYQLTIDVWLEEGGATVEEIAEYVHKVSPTRTIESGAYKGGIIATKEDFASEGGEFSGREGNPDMLIYAKYEDEEEIHLDRDALERCLDNFPQAKTEVSVSEIPPIWEDHQSIMAVQILSHGATREEVIEFLKEYPPVNMEDGVATNALEACLLATAEDFKKNGMEHLDEEMKRLDDHVFFAASYGVMWALSDDTDARSFSGRYMPKASVQFYTISSYE